MKKVETHKLLKSGHDVFRLVLCFLAAPSILIANHTRKAPAKHACYDELMTPGAPQSRTRAV